MSRKPAILLAAVAILALAIPAVADAKKGKKKGGPQVTVMTRNVYLGADLSPAIDATTLAGAIDGAGTIVNEVVSTKFADRAAPLAREIKKSKADLIGLQEVALWREQTPSDYTATDATKVKFDFLALLEQAMADAGAKYEVVHVQQEFDEELPADTDHNNATGVASLGGADVDGRLTMRDVLLVKKGSDVEVGKTASGQYTTVYAPKVGGVLEVPVERGWQSVEAKVDSGKGKASKFRFVNTHLEAFGEPTIREAQAKELLAAPLDTGKQVILVGDLNSGIKRHNEPELPGDDLAFKVFDGAGFKDNGAKKLNRPYPQTCCYSSLFDGSLSFDHTVDHVLTNPGLKTLKATVTGDDAAERTASGLWPSDHGGKVSTVQLKK